MNNPRFIHARKMLAGSMLIMGACGIAYEYTLGALGNNLMGSSHEQIFVVIGLMMFAMGVGATLQKNIAGNLITKFLLLEIILGVTGGVSALVIYFSYIFSSSYMLLLWGFSLGIGLLIGLEIPLLIRINREYSESLKTNLSDILSMDYVGSLIGALLFTYVLLTWLAVDQIAALLGCINLLIAIIGLMYFRPLVSHFKKLSVLGCASLTVLICLLVFSDNWRISLEQRTYRDPIIHSQTSKYQHIVLTKKNNRLSLYINGHLQFNSQDEEIYHEMLVHVPFSVASSQEKVLILGGGDALALREVLKYRAVDEVHLVDIDPAITELASSHPDLIKLNQGALMDSRVSLLAPGGVSPSEEYTVTRKTKLNRLLLSEQTYSNSSVHLFNVDADRFIQESSDLYDLVIIDFSDPNSIGSAKLYSRDFYKNLAHRLKPNALIAVQSTSPYHSKEMFLCIGKTLRASGYRALPYHQNVPSFGEWGWHLAWEGGPEKAEMQNKLASIQSIPITTQYVTPQVVSTSMIFGKDWLNDDHIAINTKFQPTILRYYRNSWKN